MELEKIREQIDNVDRKLVELFEKRMELSEQVARYKRANNLPVYDSKREEQILQDRCDSLKNSNLKSEIRQLWRELMRQSRNYQERLLTGGNTAQNYIRQIKESVRPLVNTEAPRVAYLGIEGSNSHQAAVSAFSDAKPKACTGFEEVLKCLQNKEADYGVLPIENSSTGGIPEVYDLLRKYGTFIVGEQKIKIDHNLMGIKGASLETIKKVYSHSEGLAQSRSFLAEHKNWECIPYYNTAVSAKLVAEAQDSSLAAIASKRAAQIYNLEILVPNTNFNKLNFTRFIVVSNQLQVSEQADKISIYLSLPHVSGSLSHILNYFSTAGLNLTKIESRPIYNKSWEYYFYIDFTGNLNDETVSGVLADIAAETTYMEVLGNYKSAQETGTVTCLTCG